MKKTLEGTSALVVGIELFQNMDVASALSGLSIEVKHAVGGYNALSELYSRRYQVIIIGPDVTDIHPAELCRQIKQSERLSSIPVICFVSSNDSISSVLDALQAGADDCFVSPTNCSELLAKLEWLLMRGRSAAALRQYYRELRTRQAQTLGVVRATADLMESIDSDFRGENCYGSQELVAEKLEIGLGMIRSLASILENQIESFDISELIEQTDSPNGNELYRDHRSIQTGMTLELAC